MQNKEENTERPSAGANSKQVGGKHYQTSDGEQHWDRAVRLGWDIFQYQITKYIERWKLKNGIEDLEKALHFLEKYIELARAGACGIIASPPTSETHPALNSLPTRVVQDGHGFGYIHPLEEEDGEPD